MERWTAAETCYAAALDADNGVSPLSCSHLLFEWGVNAMRRRDLDRAETIFRQLDAIMPIHVPGRGHRAELALARGQFDMAMRLITRSIEISDDREYRATFAEILVARDDSKAASEAERAAVRAVAGATARSHCRPRGSLLHGPRQPTGACARAAGEFGPSPVWRTVVYAAPLVPRPAILVRNSRSGPQASKWGKPQRNQT